MKKKYISLFILLIVALSASSQCKYYNKVDKKGLKQGWWYSYWDDDKKEISSKSYYKDGRETKMSKNYYPSGHKQVKFNYNKNRIRVKYYNEKGVLAMKGWAKMEYTAKDIRYYWEGKWKFYNESRMKISESVYLDGHMISEKFFTQ